jgi:hypothetical protein
MTTRPRAVAWPEDAPVAGSIEDHAAAEEQILARAEAEPRRLAQLHRKEGLQRTVRVDPRDGSVRARAAGAIDLGNGDVEPSSPRVPDRLLRAVGRIGERALSERSAR